MLTHAAAVSLALLLVPASLMAQDSPPAKQPTRDQTPAPKTTPKSAAPTKGDKPAGYPDAVKKELYASNDLRSKAQPKFEVEKWLTAEPDRAGKTVLIDFWATWCGPCVALVPELIDFQKKFKDDLVVIGISDEKEDTVRAFMKEKKVTYSMAIDTKKKMNTAVGVKGIPHVLIVSSDGIVRWQGFPLSDEDQLTEATLKSIIDTDKAERAKNKKKTEPAKK